MMLSPSIELVVLGLTAFQAHAFSRESQRCARLQDTISELQHVFRREVKSYCRSYLHLPATAVSTVTSTSTITIVQYTALPDATVTTYLTEDFTASTDAFVTSYTPDPMTTVYTTTTLPPGTTYTYGGNAKRSPAVAIYTIPASRISSACSCIITSPQTKTVLKTSVIPASTVLISTEGPTATETTVITTSTTVTTVIVTKTIDLPPTGTAITTSVSTVTPSPVTLPATCNAKGTFSDGSYNFKANFNLGYDDCILSCKTIAECLSTGWYTTGGSSSGGPSAGTCRYYSQPVAQAADLGNGYYTFNDRACPAT